MKVKIKIQWIFFVIIGVLVTACGPDGKIFQQYTPIKTLKAHPEDYQEPFTAAIKGTVLGTFDLMGVSACKVSDGTDKIHVITSTSYREGQEIAVTGHVENMLGKGSWKILVFIEDQPIQR
jgi:hypothetical protein